ncbi:LOW QUALITY PROTEIN: RNA 5'-monophosphate methyltransferase [Dromiciops gliroides]|uniref:LOW QUALITY PROTEIN: RNA 5'-monophosphate methyltransferase n=1 Tax=Dromiciops gliroides TaxID=33562 RepID=UPI001CC4F3A5|nr:LOW QUALITY PROTEIN: RNA 5'-monophosphate methyltransferase [Dromiciops gliroides]
MAAPSPAGGGGCEPTKKRVAEQGFLEPGAAPYGNFPCYFSRVHPPEQRFRLLPPALLQQLFPPEPRSRGRCWGLDVGCNSGAEALALYRHLLSLEEGEICRSSSRDLRFLCCDIEPVWVERAEKDCPFPEAMSFVTLDIMDPQTRSPSLSSFLNQFGRSRQAFDIVFLCPSPCGFHLNHGDNGLFAFLAHLASLCLVSGRPGEPQPWKCYRAAAMRAFSKLGRHNFDRPFVLLAMCVVTWPDHIIQILKTMTHIHELVCCFGSTSWDRSLLLFRGEPTMLNLPILVTKMKHDEQR